MPLIDTARFLPGPASRACYRPLQPIVERAFGFRELEHRYQSLPDRGRSAAEFARIGLRELGVSWQLSSADKAALAGIDGPLVLCANHPCGAVEALALMDLLEEIRPGNWRVLANRILGTIPELKENLIPVEPLHPGERGRNGANGFAGALKYLRQGGALLTFPAGRVSGRTREVGTVCDRAWSDHPPGSLAWPALRSLACTWRGAEALYLQPLFRFPKAFYQRIGPGTELSRSFVIPARQRDGRALACLWKGLSAAAAQRNCRTYYGCVTISNLFHPASRAILVDFLDRHYSDNPELRRLPHPVHPFVPETRYHRLVTDAFAGEKIDALRPVIEDIENGHRSIPPLIRYYCSLGARYLAFHVEPSFGNAIYCLLRVDLNEIGERYQRRFQ